MKNSEWTKVKSVADYHTFYDLRKEILKQMENLKAELYELDQKESFYKMTHVWDSPYYSKFTWNDGGFTKKESKPEKHNEPFRVTALF